MIKTKPLNLKSVFEDRPETWFFVFLTLVFIVMYVWSLFMNPALLKPGMLILFSGLTLIHIGLHWSLLWVALFEQKPFLYILLQAVLAFAIIYLSQNMGMIFCLYLALIGQVLGLIQHRLLAVGAIVFYILLSLLSYVLIQGAEQTFWWLVGVLPMLIFVILYVSLYLRETNARTQAQVLLAELEETNHQLAAYADQIEHMTLEAERQRMARELHDTLAQGLAGLILQLEAADSYLGAANPERAQTILQQAMSRARTTLAEARQAIGDLRSAESHAGDLAAAIRKELEQFWRSTGIPAEFEGTLALPISPRVSETVLRAVAESLINIARHAQASRAAVRLDCAGSRLVLEIRDDGCGFDPVEAVGRSGHYGLLGIRERARIAGGALLIESSPGAGTLLRLELPVDGKHA